MSAYQVNLDVFAGMDAQVVGISVDSVFSHVAWQKTLGGLDYPLAADFYPHGDVASRYGILRTGLPLAGVSERAIFIVDKSGNIAWSKVYELSALPDDEEMFDQLRKLQAGAESGGLPAA